MQRKYLPGNWNWMRGEAGAGDGEVTVPEEVMRSAGEEGVEESHDDVLEPESCSSGPWKFGMELFGFRVNSSPWWPATIILGLVLRRSGIGDSAKVNHNFSYCMLLSIYKKNIIFTKHLLETHQRFKIMLFVRTKHNMQIFRIIPFIKLQNDA